MTACMVGCLAQKDRRLTAPAVCDEEAVEIAHHGRRCEDTVCHGEGVHRMYGFMGKLHMVRSNVLSWWRAYQKCVTQSGEERDDQASVFLY